MRVTGAWVVLAALTATGCADMQARARLQEVGTYERGRFYPIAAADFPGGRLEGASPSSEGSQLLVDAQRFESGIAPFVAAQGLPDGIAIDYRDQMLRELTVLLGYRERDTVYVFHGDRDGPVNERRLIGSEVLDLDSDRRLAEEVESLERWLPAQTRLMRVGRRVARAVPAKPGATPVASYGVLMVPADAATALRFGQDADPTRRIVAWVDPDGPNHQRLEVGDLVVSNGDGCVAPGAALAQPLPCRITVLRGGRPIEVEIVPEAWPRGVRFLAIDELTPNAFAQPDAVLVTLGFIDLLESDDALANVVGHELGHIVLDHVQDGPSGADALHGLLWIGIFVPVSLAAPGLGDALDELTHGLRARFNRDQEREADRAAVRHAAAAGYDPAAALLVLDVMERVAPGEAVLAEHPPYAERRAIVRSEIERLPGQ